VPAVARVRALLITRAYAGGKGLRICSTTSSVDDSLKAKEWEHGIRSQEKQKRLGTTSCTRASKEPNLCCSRWPQGRLKYAGWGDTLSNGQTSGKLPKVKWSKKGVKAKGNRMLGTMGTGIPYRGRGVRPGKSFLKNKAYCQQAPACPTSWGEKIRERGGCLVKEKTE